MNIDETVHGFHPFLITTLKLFQFIYNQEFFTVEYTAFMASDKQQLLGTWFGFHLVETATMTHHQSFGLDMGFPLDKVYVLIDSLHPALDMYSYPLCINRERALKATKNAGLQVHLSLHWHLF